MFARCASRGVPDELVLRVGCIGRIRLVAWFGFLLFGEQSECFEEFVNGFGCPSVFGG
jgi:hypothetical protein